MTQKPAQEPLRFVAWQTTDTHLQVVQKTRRAVRDAVITTAEDRVRQRRNLGIAILAFILLLVLLAPALWNGLEDMLAGEHLFDLPALMAFSAAMLFCGILAALFAAWKGQCAIEHDRGGFATIRPTEK